MNGGADVLCTHLSLLTLTELPVNTSRAYSTVHAQIDTVRTDAAVLLKS